MENNKIEFYVGIVPRDKDKLSGFIKTLNEGENENLFVEHTSTFDDPDGYLCHTIKGTWEAYKCFMEQPFLKSLEHYEE